jgi:hypothetical protein
MISGFQDMFLNPLKGYLFRREKGNVMVDLNDPDITSFIRANLTSYYGNIHSFSYEDIHEWINEYLVFVENFNGTKRSNDPRVILTNGIGKCQEYGILFASACLSIGKEVRILHVAKSDFADLPHAFNEVKRNSSWVQADCSVNHDKLFLNDTSCYKNWYWWPKIGSNYEIIAESARKIASIFLHLIHISSSRYVSAFI